MRARASGGGGEGGGSGGGDGRGRRLSRKSSLTIQFVEGQFVDSYDPTIENTFTKLITVNGQEYHLQVVDTAGQDEYSIFPQTYSIDINGYILVYSVTSIKSEACTAQVPWGLCNQPTQNINCFGSDLVYNSIRFVLCFGNSLFNPEFVT
ncbi:GTP-binding protein Rheb isoform X3 [Podarcis muralis]